MTDAFNFDALLPAEIAKKAEDVGARKCQVMFQISSFQVQLPRMKYSARRK
jgi:hypothetical protein